MYGEVRDSCYFFLWPPLYPPSLLLPPILYSPVASSSRSFPWRHAPPKQGRLAASAPRRRPVCRPCQCLQNDGGCSVHHYRANINTCRIHMTMEGGACCHLDKPHIQTVWHVIYPLLTCSLPHSQATHRATERLEQDAWNYRSGER